jgi:Ribbon-helix-helix protein, copG family
VKSKRSRAEYPISLRATEEDLKMLEWLHARTGLSNSALFKLALRRLYEKEGGQLQKVQY